MDAAQPRPTPALNDTSGSTRDSTSPTAESLHAGILPLLRKILRHGRILALLPAISVLGVLSVSLLLPRKYSASASFSPRNGQTSSGTLSGLAAQFGLSVAAGDATNSPAFFAALVGYKEILGPVADTRYVLSERPVDSLALADVLGVETPTSAGTRAETIRALRRITNVAMDRLTGIVSVTVTTTDPALSYQIAQRIVTAVNEFATENRRLTARSEREFANRRLQEARADLASDEDRVRTFLQRNRYYTADPQLVLEYERLSREVAARQQVVMVLTQAYEQSRLESSRDTPAITLLERPEVPARPDPRFLIVRALLALIGGLVVASLWIAAEDLRRHMREGLRALRHGPDS